MFEAERQAYLKALGIMQYVPREPIAGALESPVLTDSELYPPPAAPIAEETPHAHREAAPTPAEAGDGREVAERREQRDMPDERPANPGEQKPPEAPVAPGSEPALSADGITVNIPRELLEESPEPAAQGARNPAPVSPAVEFCFALIQTSAGIAMLTELGDPGVKDMSAQEHRLMGDILQALQVPPEACRYQYFKWPLVNNPRIRQGWPEARETLQAYLDDKLGASGASTLVIFGDQPLEALRIENDQLAVSGRALMTVQTPALHRMLSDWRLKARVWGRLAPLRGRHV
ncbi:MAG: hypothetical protein R3208_13400 [Ketobacteraceae bacterium]|nr:hypothetical protein [Ketobacteraceae bacterium]